MDCTRISDLQLSKGSYKVKVRLIRLWHSTNPNMGDEVMSLDFVIVDEMGDTMQGTIRKQDVVHFKEQLHEGRIYIFSSFIVCPGRESFRVVPRNLIIRFTRSTSIMHVSEDLDTLPRYKFNFVDFPEISSRIYNDLDLTDVVGHIISVSRLGNTYVRNNLTKKKNVEIQDLSENKMLVTLWGKIADAFPENVVLSKSKPVIVVFFGMTVRTFMGQTCLCSSSEIPEIQMFRESIDPLEVTTLMSSERFTTLSPAEELVDNKITITELETLDPDLHQSKRFTCTARIVDIDTSDGWWYNSCNQCKAALKEFESKFWCDRCCIVEEFPLPWYKLTIIVQDETSYASFIMFGSLVADLIGVSCLNLTSTQKHDILNLPPAFRGLIGRRFNFRIILGFRDSRKKVQAKVVKIIPDSTATDQTSHGTPCGDSSSQVVSNVSADEKDTSTTPEYRNAKSYEKRKKIVEIPPDDAEERRKKLSRKM